MSTENHVKRFVSEVDPVYSMNAFAKKFVEQLEQDKSLATKMEALQKKLSEDNVVISQLHSFMFEKIKSLRSVPEIPTAPEWLRPVLPMLFAKAKSVFANGSAKKLFDMSHNNMLDVVSKFYETLEPDFIGELLVATTMAANESKEFTAQLHRNAAEFYSMVTNVYDHKETFPSQNAVLRSAGTSGNNSGSCTACRYDGAGHRICEPISCWVIVVIIIIIIVTK